MSAEKTLLGGILKTPFIIDIVSTRLDVEDFVSQSYQKIYKRILEIYNRKGYYDNFIVQESFGDDSETKESIIDVIGASNTFDPKEILQYISRVKEDKQIVHLRNLGKMLTDDKTYTTNSAKYLTDSVARMVFSTDSPLTHDPEATDIVGQMREEIIKYQNKDLWGFPTGFRSLDNITRGLQQGQIWVIGAYTSVGKSWFSLHIANAAALAGAKVLYLSTEMVERRLAWRLVAMRTKIPEFLMISDRMNYEQRARRDIALEELVGNGIKFVSGINKVDQVIYQIKKAIMGRNCDVVIIDFIQNLATGRDEYEELSDAIRKLQSMAISENICVVVASQVNRESQKSGLGGAFGYKGSGTIEASADLGIILRKNPESLSEIILEVKKNRNGTTADIKIESNFSIGELKERDYMRNEVAEQYDQPPV